MKFIFMSLSTAESYEKYFSLMAHQPALPKNGEVVLV